MYKHYLASLSYSFLVSPYNCSKLQVYIFKTLANCIQIFIEYKVINYFYMFQVSVSNIAVNYDVASAVLK